LLEKSQEEKRNVKDHGDFMNVINEMNSSGNGYHLLNLRDVENIIMEIQIKFCPDDQLRICSKT
jgi:hypothetical protein